MMLAQPQAAARRAPLRPRQFDQGPSDDQLRRLAMEIIRFDPHLARQLEQAGQRQLSARTV